MLVMFLGLSRDLWRWPWMTWVNESTRFVKFASTGTNVRSSKRGEASPEDDRPLQASQTTRPNRPPLTGIVGSDLIL